MNARRFILRGAAIALLTVLAAAPPGCRKSAEAPAADVAATNSMLECAAVDLLGDDTPVLRLAEPGMCPGHFDVRPSQVERLRRCRVLLRLDFQRSLDAKLRGPVEDGLRIAEVNIPGGLCEPESYLAACRRTADALVDAGLRDRATADARLGEIERRIGETADRCRRQVEALNGTPVVASGHQAAFCRWLGLDVVATFSGADTAGTGQIDRAIRQGEQAGAELVIANLPEGRRVADALAQRLRGRVVVFGNFPALGSRHASFDDLLDDNVGALVEAARR